MSASPAPFDPRDLQSSGLGAKIARWVVDHPYGLMAFLRRFMPIPRFKTWAIITRYDDVAEALRADKQIAVPFGPKVEALNDGPNFLLGMADSPDYRKLRDLVSRLFPQNENAGVVGPESARVAAEVVERGAGRLDGVQDLITHVPIRVCEAYYGIEVPDRLAFGQWTIAMSTFMFGDPGDNPKVRRAALAAGTELRKVVDAAIARAKAGQAPPNTIAARMAADGTVPDIEARAILIGMITGFVPTNTMAAGHMLEMLLRRPEFLAAARTAALADDDERLTRCLFEAFRFKPLNPGPFRIVGEDYTVAAGTPRAALLKKGTNVLVSTQSAMHDPRRVAHPEVFDPTRPPNDYMLFGLGLHWCIGARLAEAQITQTFKPLLRRANLRRAPGAAGKLTRLGPFPAHLHVRYDA